MVGLAVIEEVSIVPTSEETKTLSLSDRFYHPHGLDNLEAFDEGGNT